MPKPIAIWMSHSTGCLLAAAAGALPLPAKGSAQRWNQQSAVGRHHPVGSDVTSFDVGPRLAAVCGAGFPRFRLCEPADP
ncbi:MAG: hypothetical protein QOD39_1734 [Mycobacterium sp.]|jgi:hypothetical protein|nr:hypothetical protein [Mycobacterium sp.]